MQLISQRDNGRYHCCLLDASAQEAELFARAVLQSMGEYSSDPIKPSTVNQYIGFLRNPNMHFFVLLDVEEGSIAGHLRVECGNIITRYHIEPEKQKNGLAGILLRATIFHLMTQQEFDRALITISRENEPSLKAAAKNGFNIETLECVFAYLPTDFDFYLATPDTRTTQLIAEVPIIK